MVLSFVRRRKLRKWVYLGIVLALFVAAYPSGIRFSRAVGLLLTLPRLAQGDTGHSLPVAEEIIQRNMNGRKVEGILYRPSRLPPRVALILSPGISELGCHHPQLVALSRFLAANGFMVLTPDLQQFRELHISAEPLEEMVFWFKAVSELDDGRLANHVGLAGISFSGTLALMAAARPEVRDSVTFVLGVGSYCNLLEMTREWFAADSAKDDKRYYATRFYARWLIMGAALDLLPSDTDRKFLQEVFLSLLKQNRAPATDPGLSPEALRWYKLAVDRHQSDSALTETIENHLRPLLFEKLDPSHAAAQVLCPVFLIHGAYDDLITPDQSRELKQRISRAETHLMITPFLTHTHAPQAPLSWRQKLSANWQGLLFLYAFAGVAH